jgi:hypothetical protein
MEMSCLHTGPCPVMFGTNQRNSIEENTWAFFLNILALENGTDRQFRNVRNGSTYAAQQLRRGKISTSTCKSPEILHAYTEHFYIYKMYKIQQARSYEIMSNEINFPLNRLELHMLHYMAFLMKLYHTTLVETKIRQIFCKISC